MNKLKKYWEKLYSRKSLGEDENLEELRKIEKTEKRKLKKEWELKNIDNEDQLYHFKQKKKINIYTIIFYISLSFFILAGGLSFIILSLGKNKIPQIDLLISLKSPPIINSGENFRYELNFENRSEKRIKNLKLIIDYPDDVYDYQSGFVVKKDEVRIKEILPGENKSVVKNIAIFGSQNEEKKIDFFITYQIDGYSYDFSQKKEFLVKIASSPIFVKINAPKKIKSGDEFNMDIEVISNTNRDLKNIVVIGRFPNGFENIESNPNPYFSTPNKSVFKIPLLKVGDKVHIKFRAKIIGQNSEKKVIQFLVGSIIDKSNYELKTKFFEIKEEIVIKKPNFDIQLLCKDAEKNQKEKFFILKPNKRYRCSLEVKNNLNDKVDDLNIELGYDDNFSNLVYLSQFGPDGGGYLDSNHNKIIWNRFTSKIFKSIEAFSNIKIGVIFSTKTLNELAGYFNNPSFVWNFKIFGNSYNKNAVAKNGKKGVVDYEFKQEFRFRTDVKVVQKLLYDKGPFENYGGPKPEPGVPVTYTLKLEVYNSTNQINDFTWKAKLPVGVEFKNVFEPKDAYIKYNKNTREISWYIKKIKPFIGYRTDPKTLYLQLEFSPSLSDYQLKEIIDSPWFSYYDSFVKKEYRYSLDNVFNRKFTTE